MDTTEAPSEISVLVYTYLTPDRNSMYLHTIILTLFRPFLQGPQRDQKLRVFTSADSSPSAIYEASVTQLKHIVLQHHLDYPDKLFSSFACAGYMQLCSAIAAGTGPAATASTHKNTTKSERRENRFYFDICMCFFQDMNLQHALALPVAQGLLCMALQSHLIRASKARKILKQFQKRGERHHSGSGSGSLLENKMAAFPSSSYPSTAAQPMQSQIIVNFELAVVDVGAARAHSLASRLEDLVLFDEFTIDTTTMTDADHEDDGDEGYENENENDYESSAQSGGSVIGSDYYWTPASDMCRDIDNCWMGGCDGS